MLKNTVVMSDADGNCSASIIYMFLKDKSPLQVFSHTGKQHGLNDVIDEVAESDCKLIIIPDAGSNDVKECMQLKMMGKDIIILDHHLIEKKNKYAVIVNHNMGTGLNVGLSGTGVTYKFIQAYCELYHEDCPDYNDIVAVSLISDVCDLRYIENRAFIDRGFNHPANPFLKLLFEKQCRGIINPHSTAWSVAPLANALARVDEQETKRLFFDALVGDIDAEEALTDIRRVKRQQDSTVKTVVEDIEPTLNLSHKAIIGFTESENKGFIGLIANKFTGKYRKPTILLREMNSTTYSGSLRSPVPLLDIINESKLAKCQGHGEACGLTVKKANLKRLQSFLDTLNLEVDPIIDVTVKITPKSISTALAHLCVDNKMLWGKNLPEPTFCVTLTHPEVFVYEKKTTTVKLLQDGVSFMLFRATPEDVDTLQNLQGKAVELIITLDVNEWEGVESPQGMIEQYEIVEQEKNDNWETWF